MLMLVLPVLLYLLWSSATPHRHVAPVRVGSLEMRPRNKELIRAIDKNNARKVKSLLDKGVSADSVYISVNDEGRSGLQLAAANGYEEIVRLLLDHGADVNAPDLWGGTAIVSASIDGQAEIVKLLISRGADVNADDDGATALGYALHLLNYNGGLSAEDRARYERVVSLLRQAGAKSSPFSLW
jgi:ankyrin repeat protein